MPTKTDLLWLPCRNPLRPPDAGPQPRSPAQTDPEHDLVVLHLYRRALRHVDGIVQSVCNSELSLGQEGLSGGTLHNWARALVRIQLRSILPFALGILNVYASLY